MKEKRINQLDGMRIIACLMIVWGHCSFIQNSSFDWIHKNFNSSTFALDFFFLLSGFGIYYSSSQKQSLTDSYGLRSCLRYASKKIRKIYPYYLISLLLFLPLNIKRIKEYIIRFSLNLTLSQSLFPSVNISHSINGVCWFLSVVFLSYILAPVYFSIVKKTKRDHIALGCILVLTIGINYISLVVANKSVTILGHSFIFDLGSTVYSNTTKVLCGMYLAKLAISDKKTISSRIVTFSVVISFALWVLYNPLKNVLPNTIVYALELLSTANLIYTLVLGNGRIIKLLSGKRVIEFSRFTMYIYLFHYPIIHYIETITKKLTKENTSDIIIITEFVAVILFTFLFSYFVDKIFKNRKLKR